MFGFFILLLILLLNGLFMAAEISILTATKHKLVRMANKGNDGAKFALELKNKIEFFLCTVQIAVTFLNVILGLLGGISIANELEEWILTTFYIDETHKHIITIISSVTAVSFVTYLAGLSELVPKRLAVIYPEIFASKTSRIMIFFTKVSFPLISFMTFSVAFIIKKILRIDIKEDNHISIDEIKSMISQAETSGTLNKMERFMMIKLANINSMTVGSIMTPRNKIVSLDLAIPNNENLKRIKEHSFNYFPVIEKSNINNIVGLLCTKNCINVDLDNSTIEKISKNSKIMYIPELVKVTTLIEMFKENKIKIAVVVDEYGEVEGIVTLNDILKTFIGDLANLIKGNDTTIINKGNGSYIVSGNTHIDDINELFSVNLVQFEGNNSDYVTLATFLLDHFNGIPKVGDSILIDDIRFKILKVIHFRIDKVLIFKENEKKDEDQLSISDSDTR